MKRWDCCQKRLASGGRSAHAAQVLTALIAELAEVARAEVRKLVMLARALSTENRGGVEVGDKSPWFENRDKASILQIARGTVSISPNGDRLVTP